MPEVLSNLKVFYKCATGFSESRKQHLDCFAYIISSMSKKKKKKCPVASVFSLFPSIMCLFLCDFKVISADHLHVSFQVFLKIFAVHHTTTVSVSS